ncbi:SAM hydrolase/SAM-dependent halogenase family protein [Sulfuracidifex metallicus]|uniref:SAM-dependent chlorinase/fluorinase n=1 Tax=Sulfuracidifex metallicus DSM 6482 = JCM 9184 TaxID=523847 RepID=A0A6A9QMY1_SULME|nr:SAM-dependent chlorinase/fluorinase [Sulfuracidifex metallicus]MUN28635.1 hypothetical protein [Sulfuracidifex metallicus DSM 6482 = JCM 9184]WOE50835.1 SAM-dependent chlorinase/fluorinase [Sulfuracidifex metallicus DSM 6482 = JCM 9184]
MAKTNNIAILTDFSLYDNYNGVMEGVIRNFNKDAKISYLSGNVKKFNLSSAAYLLYTGYRFFPKRTVFLVVVDPGVGTERHPIVAKTKNYYFVGPDNGILYPAIMDDGISEIRIISNPKLFLSNQISRTFHGRDIFAISAALISVGVQLDTFGNRKDERDLVPYNIKFFKRDSCGIIAKVIYVDNFGNVALNIHKSEINLIDDKIVRIKTRNGEYNARVVKTFGYGKENELIIYSNGFGFIEIGINKGSAHDILKTSEGDEVCLEGFTQGDFNHSI